MRTRTRDGSAEWLACDDRAVCRGLVLGITGSALSLLDLGSLSLAISLSLLLSWGRIDLKVKDKQKLFYRVKGHILRLTKMIFRLTQFSLRTQTPSRV